MRIIEGAKDLTVLFKDYSTMSKEEKADFFEAKCDYYQKYVELGLAVGCFSSICFIFFDYVLNGSYLPTLLPRLSILGFMAVFFILARILKSRTATVFLDYFLGHALVITTIWATFHLDNSIHAGEVFILMNLIWITIGFVAKPHETVISALVFLAEILISHSLIGYDDPGFIFSFGIISAIAVILSHCLLMLYFLDHYRIRQQLELAMITDPLTQVYNRHLLEKIVSRNTLKEVNEGEPVAIAMLDIDYFKKINDDHGHYTGDLTLLYIGQKLSKETHGDDYVIRYGGEEFVIILKNCDVNNACARMEQFRRDIESSKDTPVPFTVSIGVSRYTGDYSKSIQNVETALNKAKNSGRNNVVVV